MSPIAGDIPERAHSNVKSWREVKNAIDVLNQRIGEASTGGTVHTLQSKGVQVGDSDIEILDFGKGFKLAEGPDRDISVTLKSVFQKLFAGTADDTVANTTVETAFAPAGVGSLTIVGNSLKVGDVIRVTASGILSTA